MIFIGIDPGSSSGAIAIIDDHDKPKARPTVTVNAIGKLSDVQMWDLIITAWQSHQGSRAVIEQVASMPGQGVSSTFKFGCNYGKLLGMLTAAGIPYDKIIPQTWKKLVNCPSGSKRKVLSGKKAGQLVRDKSANKRSEHQRAAELYPDVKLPSQALAAALLLAHACRMRNGAATFTPRKRIAPKPILMKGR